VFAGLLLNARDGDSYYTRTNSNKNGGANDLVFISYHAREGRTRGYSFPVEPFERAIFRRLAEVDPPEVLGEASTPDPVLSLSGELAAVDESIALIEADLNEHGESPTLFKRLRAKEAEKTDLARRLAEARQSAASPPLEAWGEALTLLGALDSAADLQDARLRLRSALRRIVREAWLLVMPRGRDRLCAVQMHFEGDTCRQYVILHRPPKANARARQRGGLGVVSFAAAGLPGNIDLRHRGQAGPSADVALLEALLSSLNLAEVPLEPGGPA
jgi:hypothetical protein